MKEFSKIFSTILLFTLVSVVIGCQNLSDVEYTIHYESYYGTVPEDKKVTNGYLLTNEDLPTLESEDYIFNGWDKEAGFEVIEDVTITASWKDSNGNPVNNPDGEDPHTKTELQITSNQNGDKYTLTPDSGFSDNTWTLNSKSLDTSCSVDNNGVQT